MRTRSFARPLLAILALLLLGLGGSATAQTLRIDDIDASRFVDKNEIRFYVDLLDREGRVIDGLSSENLSILIDDKLIPGREVVEPFFQTPDAVAVAIIVGANRDYLTEAGETTPFKMALSGVEQFVRKMRPVDRVSLWMYDEKSLRRVSSFQEGGDRTAGAITRQAEALTSEEAKGAPGAPRLYQDLLTALRKDLRDEFESVPTIRRRVIVVMSDGLDAMGKKDQQKIQGLVNDIAGIALDEHIKVYTIGFSTIGQEGFVYLTQLSNKTDGAPRLLPDESGPSDIDGAWIELGEQLKRQYVVSFYPEDLDGGQTVKFQIKAEIGGANISTVAPMSTALGEKPFDWKLALIWTGSILGGLLFIFLIYKLIVGWMRRPPKAEPEVVMVETGPTGPTRGKLQITKGPCVGEIHYLTDDVTTIGSTDGNTIVLADPSVSKRHAGIKIEDLRYELADFGSTNKVYVNGRVITKQFLKDGDEIRLGDSEMVFSLK